MSGEPLLRVTKLNVSFGSGERQTQAVRDVSFTVDTGQIVGLVGESGSGKTTIGYAILGLLPPQESRVQAECLQFEGRDIRSLSSREWDQIRGRRIALIPQEPLSALNPTLTIDAQLWLILRRTGLSRQQGRAAAAAQFAKVGLRDAERMMRSYPFQLSGGQRQRILIAAAFLNKPALVIADEPTTALDVTVQAEILNLVLGLAREEGTSVIFITHNLGVAWRMCDDLLVLKSGEILERGPCRNVLSHPGHPYTRSLLAALPSASAPRSPLPVAG